MNFTFALNVFISLLLLSNSSFSPADQKADSSKKAELPFAFELGKTTLPESREIWGEAHILSITEGKAALGTGSGVDNLGKVSAPDIDLIDIDNVDFEGATLARFVYFKGVLYSVQAQLNYILDKNHPSYSEEKIKSIKDNLITKYGKPSKQQAMYGDVLLWRFPNQNTLAFSSSKTKSSLIYINERIDKEAKKYIKEYCKTINTKDSRTCW